MTTKLDKNVRKIIAHHGGTVVQRGVTGGNWSNCDGLVEGRGTGDARTAVRSRYGMRSSRLMMRTSSPIM